MSDYRGSPAKEFHVYERSSAPTSEFQIGALWADTSGTTTLKICTSTNPITFVEAGGGGTSSMESHIVLLSVSTPVAI